tara:strand:- start:78 stop:650 length:573 start_codon:yes stop_codon:yes gene_type:complete
MNLNFSPSFIEVYDNALPKNECDILISEFDKFNKVKGSVFSNSIKIVDTKVKDSIELENCSFLQATKISSILSTRLDICLEKYKKKYSDIFGNYVSSIAPSYGYTFKKFEKGGGFKRWHYEHGPNDAQNKRVLVWTFYLNNAAGTDFMFYSNVSGKEGRCVIFPASFNYMHRSAPNKSIKYIATGWIDYV